MHVSSHCSLLRIFIKRISFDMLECCVCARGEFFFGKTIALKACLD